MNKKKIITLTAGVIIVAGAAFWLFGGSTRKQQVSYEMVKVGPADISNFVTATGTIEPVTEVEVGTQVSGIIDKIYVDYNTVVKEGQLIAEMDKVTHRKRTGLLAGHLRRRQSRIRVSEKELRTQQGTEGQEPHQRHRLRAIRI